MLNDYRFEQRHSVHSRADHIFQSHIVIETIAARSVADLGKTSFFEQTDAPSVTRELSLMKVSSIVIGSRREMSICLMHIISHTSALSFSQSASNQIAGLTTDNLVAFLDSRQRLGLQPLGQVRNSMVTLLSQTMRSRSSFSIHFFRFNRIIRFREITAESMSHIFVMHSTKDIQYADRHRTALHGFQDACRFATNKTANKREHIRRQLSESVAATRNLKVTHGNGTIVM